MKERKWIHELDNYGKIPEDIIADLKALSKSRYQITREVVGEYLSQKHVRGGNIIHENLDYWLDQQEENE